MTTRKRIALAAAGLISAALISAPGAALAADTHPVWEGYATTTAASSACAGVDGALVGATYVSIYRPSLQTIDPPAFPSLISFFHLRTAMIMQNGSESSAPQFRGSGDYLSIMLTSRSVGVQTQTSGGSGYAFAISPSTVTTSTPAVQMKGIIHKFANVAGCDVSFKAIYAKRID